MPDDTIHNPVIADPQLAIPPKLTAEGIAVMLRGRGKAARHGAEEPLLHVMIERREVVREKIRMANDLIGGYRRFRPRRVRI